MINPLIFIGVNLMNLECFCILMFKDGAKNV